jgi:hypothetical protein
VKSCMIRSGDERWCVASVTWMLFYLSFCRVLVVCYEFFIFLDGDNGFLQHAFRNL